MVKQLRTPLPSDESVVDRQFALGSRKFLQQKEPRELSTMLDYFSSKEVILLSSKHPEKSMLLDLVCHTVNNRILISYNI